MTTLALGVVFSVSGSSIAQHAFDTESWLELRQRLRQKEGPRPSIEEDLAALAEGDARLRVHA